MTKGDSNAIQDGWIVPTNNVVATYDHVTIPYLGYYLDFIRTKMGLAMVLIIPGAFLIISQIISLTQAFRKEAAAKKNTVEINTEA